MTCIGLVIQILYIKGARRSSLPSGRTYPYITMRTHTSPCTHSSISTICTYMSYTSYIDPREQGIPAIQLGPLRFLWDQHGSISLAGYLFSHIQLSFYSLDQDSSFYFLYPRGIPKTLNESYPSSSPFTESVSAPLVD